MKRKRILALLFSVIMTFSMFGSSCAEEPIPPIDEPVEEGVEPNNPVTPPDESEQLTGDEDGEEEQWLYVVYRNEYRLVPYLLGDEKIWHLQAFSGDTDELPSPTYEVRLPWSGLYGNFAEPGDVVFGSSVVVEISDIFVSPSVYNYLEGWSSPNEKKQFLFLMTLDPLIADEWSSTESYFEQFFPGIQAIDDTLYGSWEGTAEEFKRIATSIQEDPNDLLVTAVCFPEDIKYLFGVTIEQASILVRKGHLDYILDNSVKGSPLYGLTRDEIAAYLAEHPELLEETA